MATIPARNPLIHKNLAATVDPSGNIIRVKRGYIQTEDGKRRLNFLFNPSSDINASYGLDVDQGSFNIMNAWDTRDTGKLRIMPNQVLTFNLLFDRMYEVWEGSMPTGCQVDIDVAKAIVGLYDSVSGGGIQSPTDGIMLFSPVDIVLSSNKGASRFFGVIEQMSFDYTIMSREQIPLRISMGFTVRLMPKISFDNSENVAPNAPDFTPQQEKNQKQLSEILLQRGAA